MRPSCTSPTLFISHCVPQTCLKHVDIYIRSRHSTVPGQLRIYSYWKCINITPATNIFVVNTWRLILRYGGIYTLACWKTFFYHGLVICCGFASFHKILPKQFIKFARICYEYIRSWLAIYNCLLATINFQLRLLHRCRFGYQYLSKVFP